MRRRNSALLVALVLLVSMQGQAQRKSAVKRAATPAAKTVDARHANAVLELLSKMDSVLRSGMGLYEYRKVIDTYANEALLHLTKISNQDVRTGLGFGVQAYVDIYRLQDTPIVTDSRNRRLTVIEYLIAFWNVEPNLANLFYRGSDGRNLSMNAMLASSKKAVAAALVAMEKAGVQISNENSYFRGEGYRAEISRRLDITQVETVEPQVTPVQVESQPNLGKKPPVAEPAPTCPLGLSQSVELRGFRLGMTLAQIQQRFPGATYRVYGATNTPEIVLRPTQPTDFMLDGKSIRPYSDVTLFDASQFPGYEGVKEIKLAIINERVSGIQISYHNDGLWKDNSDFVKMLSDMLKLPNAWKSTSAGQILSCEGWTLGAETYPSLSIVNLNDLATNQKAEDEEQQKRRIEEERRRKLFKP